MAQTGYAVVLDGTLTQGADRASVMADFAALFKISPHQAERLFISRATLKRNVSLEIAQRLAAALQKIGAVVKVVPAEVGADAVPVPERLLAEELVSAFGGAIEKRPATLAHRAIFAGVATAILSLPVLYLGVLAIVVAALAWYGASVVFGAIATPYWLPLLSIPLLAGALLLLFLLKPFLVQRVEERFPLDLSRSDDPLLFVFVDAIADKLNAPRPRSIAVACNARVEARYERSFRGLRGDVPKLVVGLPLLASMNTRQLAGAIAYALGHFARGPGWLPAYITHRVYHELYRAVEERDVWDERLTAWTEARGGVPGSVADAVLRLSEVVRRGLAAGLRGAEFVGAPALRRMEFDADAYQAALTGSVAFRADALRLRQLEWAFDETTAEVEELWAQQRLVDDLPAAITHKLSEITPELAAFFEEALHDPQQGIGLPPDADRIEAAEELGVEGAFTLEVPSYALLAHPQSLVREATLRFYHHNLGVEITPDRLVSRETMAAVVTEAREEGEALRDYCRSIFMRGRYLALARVSSIDDAARRTELNSLIRRLRRILPDLDALKGGIERIDARLGIAHAARVLGQASPKAHEISRRLSAQSYDELQTELARLRGEMSQPEALLRRRLGLALEGAMQWQGLDDAQRTTLERVLRATQALHKLQAAREELHLAGEALIHGLQADAMLRRETRGAVALPGPFMEMWYRRTRQSAAAIESALKRLPAPIGTVPGARSIWEQVRAELPKTGTPDDLVAYVRALVEAVDRFHEQLMRHLASTAMRYERFLGVDPLSVSLARPPVLRTVV